MPFLFQFPDSTRIWSARCSKDDPSVPSNDIWWLELINDKREGSLFQRIAKSLNTTLITRVIKLDYGSARELAKLLPQNKQAKAYRTRYFIDSGIIGSHEFVDPPAIAYTLVRPGFASTTRRRR